MLCKQRSISFTMGSRACHSCGIASHYIASSRRSSEHTRHGKGSVATSAMTACMHHIPTLIDTRASTNPE